MSSKKQPRIRGWYNYGTLLLVLVCVASFTATPVTAAQSSAQSSAKHLSGRILLQVESYGRAWYINPVDGMRYYLRDGSAAYELMRTMGLGITNADLERIPEKTGQRRDASLVDRLRGRILIQVEEHGEAWYVNPVNGLRYYLRDGDAAYTLMRTMALGITNANLAPIPMNPTQLVHDTTFDDVAYVKVTNNVVMASRHADQLLPPASMTKLMTALVLLDLQPDWNSAVRVTAEHLAYPRVYVGDDATSEVELVADDLIRFEDLWTAMLVASSNQATIALADSTGLSRDAFITAMNKKAQGLGLTKTIFYDPTGLSAHTVTTPREMAIIAEQAFLKTEILTAMSRGSYSFTTLRAPTREISVTDRNYSLKTFGAEAAKTGFLDEAQRCVSLKKGNNIVVVMHARSMSERNEIVTSLLQ